MATLGVKMNACDSYIDFVEKKLPELCSVKDLVAIGIFKSEQSAYHARRHGDTPEFFLLPNHRVAYPKIGIIDFLKKHKFSGKV